MEVVGRKSELCEVVTYEIPLALLQEAVLEWLKATHDKAAFNSGTTVDFGPDGARVVTSFPKANPNQEQPQ